MRLPKTFLKDKKSLEKKVKEYSAEVVENEILGSFNEEEMTHKICEYIGTYQFFYYPSYRNKVKEQVHKLNYRKPQALGEIKDRMNNLEAELEKYKVEWDWIAKDCYNERVYKEAKRDIRSYWMKAGMIYYSSVVNYIPAKVAKFFFDKSKPDVAPTGWDIMGMASYLTILTGEAILFNMAFGYLWVFMGVAILTGIVHGVSSMEREREGVKEDKAFIKEYKKIHEKKETIKSLKEEKQQIVELIKDSIKIDIL